MNVENMVKSADRYGDLDVIPASAARRMEARMLIMERAIVAIGNVIAESDGVAGLHLNGNIATWDWLEQDWLRDYAAAVRFLAEQHDA